MGLFESMNFLENFEFSPLPFRDVSVQGLEPLTDLDVQKLRNHSCECSVIFNKNSLHKSPNCIFHVYLLQGRSEVLIIGGQNPKFNYQYQNFNLRVPRSQN